MKNKFDFIIIGAGIVGLSIAKDLNINYPNKKILIIEKENDVGFHSSGRNSGVLHAGFYYSADSLKAKFTKSGNLDLKNYCRENNLKLNECGKVVVVNDETQLPSLFKLEKRGKLNQVDVKLIDENELAKIEPNAKTHKYALYSPSTATVDPLEIVQHLKKELSDKGIVFSFNSAYFKKMDKNSILTSKGVFSASKIINAAGLYADKIAKDFGFSKNYIIIPFKGIYLKYNLSDAPVRTNIYPVPDLKNPFLGVHYTITVDNTIKIGPTAIPAFWRENYSGFDNFKINESVEILFYEAILFFTNAFGFRDLAFDEIKKYRKSYLASLAKGLVNNITLKGFKEWSKPGIRAQLLNINSLELVQDFVVEGDENSIHILNAVSPAFTSCFPFAKWVNENYVCEK